MVKLEQLHYPAALKNKRVETAYTIEIKTSPDKIFPLACPVEELRWIPDWEYQLIYSRSGVNEPGCIFTENVSGPAIFGRPVTTTWVTTLHDPDKHRITFLLIMSNQAVLKWSFQARETGVASSTCTWHLVFTALDEEANGLDENNIENSLTLILSFLSDCLKHYCETGTIITL